MPTAQGISNIKANLLRPALTSHYDVYIGQPNSGGWSKYLASNLGSFRQNELHLSCCEATLPGSTLATMDILDDFHGVTERHAHRRLYDDRIDLTFYVDGKNYQPIRFFETWIKFISNEDLSNQGNNLKGGAYVYSMRYYDDYRADKLEITKFERDYKSKIRYVFVHPFPIAVTSMPISYDSSSLLKCTVSMTYLRYYIVPDTTTPTNDRSVNTERSSTNTSNNPPSPEDQAILNAMSFSTSPSAANLEANYYNTVYGEA
jgi:hypothetical protein